MKYRFWKVSVSEPEPAQDALNRFCAEQRVVSVDKEMASEKPVARGMLVGMMPKACRGSLLNP